MGSKQSLHTVFEYCDTVEPKYLQAYKILVSTYTTFLSNAVGRTESLGVLLPILGVYDPSVSASAAFGI